MRFKAPGDTAYRSLTASQVDDSSTQYQGFANVTAIVGAAGPGTYWTANVQLGTGPERLRAPRAGRSSSPSATRLRRAATSRCSTDCKRQQLGTVTIPLSGFQTPLSGPVTSTVGIVAYEGDLGTTGDGAQIQGGSGAFTALSNAVNPGPPATTASNSNVFNSTISNAGALVTSRTPSFQNNLGYDADLFRTTNVLGNAQTSTQVRLSTSGDAYQPGVVTLATDLYAPRITATKTVDQATANLGDTLTYSVAVQNTGQDGATNSTFTDHLPTGVMFVPGSIRLNGALVTDAPGDDLGEFAAGRVVVRLGTGATAGAGGTLAPNASATVSFQVTVATAGLLLGATIENTADLAFSAATTGVPSTVTTAPAITNVNVPDLAIGKTHAGTLSPGQPNTYTITVSNVGAGPTSGLVTVTDTIEPPGLILNGAATGAGWLCSTSGTTVTCTRPDPLAAGSDYPPISIPVLVSPGAVPGQLGNTASLTAASDGNPENNSFTDAGAVSVPAIDLHVEKVVTSTPNFTPVGYLFFLDPITYRIEVTNNGVADAANVQLTEVLDTPLIVESITPSQGTCSVSPPDCNLLTITAGQAPVTIDVQASASSQFSPDPWAEYPSSKLLNNTATVSAPVGAEINPDDNSASAAISTVPWAETSLTKEFSPAEPVAGGPITYTLTLHSDGPGTVDMVVADILPDALQKPPTAISISGGTGICQYDPTRENSGFPPGSPIVFCEIPQLGPGEDRVITIQSTLAPDSAGTQVDNLGLSSNTLPVTGVFSFEPDLANNDDLVSFTPGTVDVGITKSLVGPATVNVGDVATFRLVASNSGTVAATNVVVTDTLPAGLEPVDLPAGCVAAGQDVTCALGTLGPGAEQTIELRARATAAAAGSTLTNRASIRTDEADLVQGNTTGSAELTVAPLVDVAVNVAAPDGLATIGVAGSWTLRVVNRGPSTATNVTLTGTPRGAADLLRASFSQTTTPCSIAGRQIRCGLGTLAPGASRTIAAGLRPTAVGRLLLSGTVSAAEQDAVPANNTDQAAVTVDLANVTITATADPPVVAPGDPTTITVKVRTRGRRPARNASVCIRAPEHLRTKRPAGATLRNGRLCWRIARLAGGRSRTFLVRAAARQAPCARTAAVEIDVRGVGVRPRNARVLLRIRCAAARPTVVRPPFTG